MKKLLYIYSFISLSMAGCYTSGQMVNEDYTVNDYENQQEVTYQTFYNELQPYGSWIDYPGYGYVWQPNAGAEFQPYQTNGNWISTVDGWAWSSNYNWGWAPFHYGRWLNDPAIGWAWVPGYEWAPAWVTWGQYDNYYAWAPLSPGINFNIGNSWRAPNNYWSFIPYNDIGRSNLNRYIVRNRYNANIINNINIINNFNSYNNYRYHAGPDYRQVEQQTHHVIRPVRIANTTRPGSTRVSGNEFHIFRPQVAANTNTSVTPAPARVRPMRDVRMPNGNATGSGLNTNPNRGNADAGNNTVIDRTTNGNDRRIRAINPNTQPELLQQGTRTLENSRTIEPANPGTRPVRGYQFPANRNQPINKTPVPEDNRVFDRSRNIRPQQPIQTQPQRIERQQRVMPQRIERTQQPVQRIERPQPQQRTMEASRPQQPAQQRAVTPPAVRRPERVQR